VIVSVLLMVLVAALALFNWTRSNHAEEWRRHSLEVLAQTQALRNDMADTQRSTRAYLITDRARGWTPTGRRCRSSPRISSARRPHARQPAAAAHLAALSADSDALLAYSRDIIALRQQNPQQALQLDATGKGSTC